MTVTRDYPVDEFLSHCKDLLPVRAKGPDPFIEKIAEVSEYMKRRYVDPRYATKCASQFLLIMEYIARNIDEFDTDDYLVKGSEESGALVKQHLLRAVHHFLVEDSRRKSDPTPEEVREYARHIRDSE